MGCANLIFRTPSNKHYFSGYYDKVVVNASVTKHLVHQVEFIDRLPSPQDSIEVGYFPLNSPQDGFVPVGKTCAWNWQQGAMLQWLGPDFDTRLCFVDRKDGRFCSVVTDLSSNITEVHPYPFYCLDRRGEFAVVIDHCRYRKIRPGYSYSAEDADLVSSGLGEGLFLYSLTRRELSLLVDLEELNRLFPRRTQSILVEYLEHAVFSPDGKKIFFLHRYRTRNGLLRTRLFAVNISDRSLSLLNQSSRVTHCNWISADKIICFGAVDQSLSLLIRRVVDSSSILRRIAKTMYSSLVRGNFSDGNNKISRALTGDSYLLIDVLSRKHVKVLSGSLDYDGHPSALQVDSDLIVTDTYPDIGGQARLYLADVKNGTVSELARLGSIKSFDNTPLRCDLHPKVSIDGKLVSVDTMNDGVRSVYLYSLSL